MAGISVLLGIATGITGLVIAIISFLAHEWTSAGLCLIAAALAFGLTANAVLRH